MGIHTGIAYAGAGADTATEWGNGKGDGAATANKFGALSQTTGNNFNTLSGGTPAAAGATAPAPAGAAPAANPAGKAPGLASWQDFMNMGIHTGIAYAGAGADTATEWGNGKGNGAATPNLFA